MVTCPLHPHPLHWPAPSPHSSLWAKPHHLQPSSSFPETDALGNAASNKGGQQSTASSDSGPGSVTSSGCGTMDGPALSPESMLDPQ